MHNTYAYTLVAAPASLAVTNAEMENHARALGQASTQYAPYIGAAQAWVERAYGRKLVTQTWKMFLDGWPCSDRILLPFGQLTSVAHVKYYDSAGSAAATFSDTSWEISTAREPGVLALSYQASWPTVTLRVLDPVEVQFVCGWATASAVPADIRNAVLLVAGHLYEHREEVILGNQGAVDSKVLEMGARALLVNWRLDV